MTDNAPLREGKASAYEGGCRIPFIVIGPGIKPGSVNNETPINLIDLFPTFMAMAGLEHDGTLDIDGCDILPAMKGHDRAARFFNGTERDTFYLHYPVLPNAFSTIRRGTWKLMKNTGVHMNEAPEVQLFMLFSALLVHNYLEFRRRVQWCGFVEWVPSSGALGEEYLWSGMVALRTGSSAAVTCRWYSLGRMVRQRAGRAFPLEARAERLVPLSLPLNSAGHRTARSASNGCLARCMADASFSIRVNSCPECHRDKCPRGRFSCAAPRLQTLPFRGLAEISDENHSGGR